jgi:hypothetical protein
VPDALGSRLWELAASGVTCHCWLFNWLLHVPSGSTLKNTAFSPQRVFVLYSLDGVCLLRGTTLIIRYNSGYTPFSAIPARVRFVVDKVALGQVFFRILRFSLANFIPPINYPHTYSFVRCFQQKEELAKPGKLPESMHFRKSGTVAHKCAFT